MDIKGVIFDLDGVIIDSEIYAAKCAHEIFDEEGVQWDYDYYKRVIGVNETDFLNVMSERFGSIERCKEMAVRFTAKLTDGFAKKEIPFKKGAVELISYLKQAGMPICLATSAGEAKIEKAFHSNGMAVPFEHYVTGEMVTHSKPNPEIFLIGADKMGVDIKNCLIIEDSHNGMKAAIAAGAISCMVPDLLEPTDYIKENATFIKKDLFEVLDLVKQYANL